MKGSYVGLARTSSVSPMQSPTDEKVATDDPAWDASKTYVEGYNLPFWDQPFPTLMFTREGQAQFLRSMGRLLVPGTIDVFQPSNPKCAPETQRYIVARCKGSQPAVEPAL